MVKPLLSTFFFIVFDDIVGCTVLLIELVSEPEDKLLVVSAVFILATIS